MKKFSVVVDCDDVLFDCNGHAIQLLNKHKQYNYTKNDITSWGLLHTHLDERLEYFSDPVFIKTMPVLPGAKEFIHKLSKKVEIFIATSVAAECAGERVSAIIRNFPEIPLENILIGGRKDMIAADMMLDDCQDHIHASRANYPVLFRQPWNLDVSGVISVTTYDEFLMLVDLILKESIDCSYPLRPVVLVGPSGSEKNKIAQDLLLNQSDKYKKVKTYSTRTDLNHQYVSKEEFLDMKEKKIFLETSSYMGYLYGIRADDVASIQIDGYIPLMVLDINGAIAMKKHFNSRNLFVKKNKSDCIRNILHRGFSTEETINRILSLDGELKNEELCDQTITCASDV